MSDIYFSHERGTYMGVYAFVLAGSNFFAPIICGFINEKVGYKWVFYIPSIFCGLAFIFLFFFMEETNYDRKTIGVVGKGPAASEEPNTEVPINDEKTVIDSPESVSLEAATGTAYKPKTFWQKMSLFDKPRPQRMPYRFLLSLKLISWPCIFYAGFSYGSYLIWWAP